MTSHGTEGRLPRRLLRDALDELQIGTRYPTIATTTTSTPGTLAPWTTARIIEPDIIGLDRSTTP